MDVPALADSPALLLLAGLAVALAGVLGAWRAMRTPFAPSGDDEVVACLQWWGAVLVVILGAMMAIVGAIGMIA